MENYYFIMEFKGYLNFQKFFLHSRSSAAAAMTHFVVARGEPLVATGGEKFYVVYKILQKS